MPLVEHLPKIDNRRFDDIVDEAKARIPVYTPEWTDFNDNDPGMALVQLFAWMTDMMLYRLSLVPEQNYLRFLQLIGIELEPARPAHTLVSFPVEDTATETSIAIGSGTQVSAPPEDGPPIVFETDRALQAIRARLTETRTFDGSANRLVPEGESFLPFGRRTEPGSALYLGFDDADDFPEVDLLIAMAAPEEEAPSALHCPGLRPAPRTSSEIAWEYWDGAAWRSLALLYDDTLALQQSGLVELRMPAKGSLQKSDLGGNAASTLYWVRARLVDADYDTPPVLDLVTTNAVPATQAETIENEVIGGSDGSRSLSLALEFHPVLPAEEDSAARPDGFRKSSVELAVYEGSDEPVAWTEVVDFVDSGPNDRHFTVNRTTGVIGCGDGTHGLIPPVDPERPSRNILVEHYRTGGGTRGNVAAGAIDALILTIPGIDAGNVTNPIPAAGGVDEESIEDARARAPRAIKSRCRAVTSEDFELLAEQSGMARRAKALPLHHPSFPGVEVPGAVSVIVVPGGEGERPTPSAATLKAICEFLDAARLLTTELFVLPPTYKEVKITADVVAEETADTAAIQREIDETLRGYLHPLHGGADGRGWPFGGDIFFSQIYVRAAVDGVQRVVSVEIELDGRLYENCRDVPLCPGELPYSGEHEIRVRYAAAGEA